MSRLRVAHDGGTPGGPRARVHAYDLLARHGEHPEGVVGPQVRLGRERHPARRRRATAGRRGGNPWRQRLPGSAGRCRMPSAPSAGAARAAVPRSSSTSRVGISWSGSAGRLAGDSVVMAPLCPLAGEARRPRRRVGSCSGRSVHSTVRDGQASASRRRRLGLLVLGAHPREERLGALVLRVADDVLRRALLDDDAAVHEDDAVGDLAGEAHLVGDDDHRHALPWRGRA